MKLKYSDLAFKPKEINEEQRTIRAVFSTSDVDRHGEVVDQKSWILDDFLKNPVVLFGHDHSQPPVGIVTGLGYNQDGNLEGEVKFAADEYPFAKVIWNLYKGGFMRAFSVGFASEKVDIVDDQVILKNNTLYEISTVGVPANAMALAKAKGLNVEALENRLAKQLAKSLEMEVDIKDDEKFVEPEETEEAPEAEVEEEAKNLCTECKAEIADAEKGCPCKDKKPEPEEAPAEETEAEVEATEETEKTKGALADALDEVDEREEKAKRLSEVYDILDAFFTLVYDEETKPSAIPGIIAEMASLLKKVAGDVDEDKSLTVVKGINVADLAEKLLLEKAGRVLSKKNRKAIEEAMVALQAVLEADQPKEEDKKVSRDNSTDQFIKVETPAVRISVPAKGANKAKLINKAVRALLAEKRKN